MQITVESLSQLSNRNYFPFSSIQSTQSACLLSLVNSLSDHSLTLLTFFIVFRAADDPESYPLTKAGTKTKTRENERATENTSHMKNYIPPAPPTIPAVSVPGGRRTQIMHENDDTDIEQGHRLIICLLRHFYHSLSSASSTSAITHLQSLRRTINRIKNTNASTSSASASKAMKILHFNPHDDELIDHQEPSLTERKLSCHHQKSDQCNRSSLAVKKKGNGGCYYTGRTTTNEQILQHYFLLILTLLFMLSSTCYGQECFRGWRRYRNHDIIGRVSPISSRSVYRMDKCMKACAGLSKDCKSFLFKEASTKYRTTCHLFRSTLNDEDVELEPKIPNTYPKFTYYEAAKECKKSLDGRNDSGEKNRKEKPKLIEQNNWGDWSTCSASCGGGLQIREKICAGCTEGILKEIRGCNIVRCRGETKLREVKGRWSVWTSWTPCDNPCEGLRQRFRQCYRGLDFCEKEGKATKESEQKECRCARHDLRPTGFWTNWGRWSQCSVTCGVGDQVRTRQCTVPESCDGLFEQRQECDLGPCPTDTGRWSEWTDWGLCSETCDSGVRERTRTCLEGDCNGLDAQTKPCSIQPCIRTTAPPIPGWQRWLPWEDCSVTCNRGDRIRRRFCPPDGLCPGSASETGSCFNPRCVDGVRDGWLSWEPWSSCSVTCGVGERVRLRACPEGGFCPGRDQDRDTCREPACNGVPRPGWLEWSTWSFCSVTCGLGERTRNRICPPNGRCPGRDVDTQTCDQPQCPGPPRPGWLEWSPFSLCSVTCGTGERIRDRICPPNGRCPGSDIDRVRCTEPECPGPVQLGWETWGFWSDCSVTCGRGERVRDRICPPDGICLGRSEEFDPCIEPTCPGPSVRGWEPWEPWSDCSETCGTGERFRERFCPEDGICPGRDSEFDVCNEGPCLTWGQWSTWSPCPVTCGRGEQNRRRICPRGGDCTGQDTDSKTCQLQQCPGPVRPVWEQWESWTDCSETCGLGSRERRRRCPIFRACPGDEFQTEECLLESCVVRGWEPWEQWSFCSRTCGEGTRERFRNCPNAGRQNCPGSDSQVESCSDGPCDVTKPPTGCQEWTPWSTCSVTCGPGGIQNRIRVCGIEYTPEIDQKPCRPGPCNTPVWLAWGEWSDCSRTCDGGSRFRNRRCSVPGAPECRGSDTDTERCRTEACPVVGRPVWLLWTDWSDCGVTCGSARRFRTRECSEPLRISECRRDGPARQDEFCPLPPCVQANWGFWTSWSGCGVTCGEGERSRTRVCNLPGQCPGVDDDFEVCFEPPCPRDGWSTWGPWTGCSITCGDLGSRTRRRACLIPGQCAGPPTETEICDPGPCEGWSPWSTWNVCSSTCGQGVRRRTRSCPVSGVCRGQSGQDEPCFAPPCPRSQWLTWEPWTDCSRSCGFGERQRIRRCSDPGRCSGRRVESEACDLGPCLFLDWSGWSPWSICSASCQQGMRMRARACPKTGGCPGEGEEMQFCNEQGCPLFNPTTSFVTVTTTTPRPLSLLQLDISTPISPRGRPVNKRTETFIDVPPATAVYIRDERPREFLALNHREITTESTSLPTEERIAIEFNHDHLYDNSSFSIRLPSPQRNEIMMAAGDGGSVLSSEADGTDRNNPIITSTTTTTTGWTAAGEQVVITPTGQKKQQQQNLQHQDLLLSTASGGSSSSSTNSFLGYGSEEPPPPPPPHPSSFMSSSSSISSSSASLSPSGSSAVPHSRPSRSPKSESESSKIEIRSQRSLRKLKRSSERLNESIKNINNHQQQDENNNVNNNNNNYNYSKNNNFNSQFVLSSGAVKPHHSFIPNYNFPAQSFHPISYTYLQKQKKK